MAWLCDGCYFLKRLACEAPKDPSVAKLCKLPFKTSAGTCLKALLCCEEERETTDPLSLVRWRCGSFLKLSFDWWLWLGARCNFLRLPSAPSIFFLEFEAPRWLSLSDDLSIKSLLLLVFKRAIDCGVSVASVFYYHCGPM